MPKTFAIDAMPVRQGNRFVSANDARPYKERRPSKFKMHQFLCFDGEGFDINNRHEYVYLAAYDGVNVSAIRNDDEGLSSIECFEFLTHMAGRNKNAIHVIYGGSYDANMMMRDLPMRCLRLIRENGWARWGNYRIEYTPWKMLQITNYRTHQTCRLWDVIGFFQLSFQASIEKWLGINSTVINKGKAKRSKFTKDDIENIIAYCHEELKYFELLCQQLWECLDGVDITIKRWDGAGAIAQSLMGTHSIQDYKGTQEAQDKHYILARYAYAGGRFECFMPGDFTGPIYGYDINSAYPYAISQLPPFTRLTKCRRDNHFDCNIGQYDLLRIYYEVDMSYPIHPYFHRGNNLTISYPNRTDGYHWAPEYLSALKHGDAGDILEHYVWRDNGKRPFAWVQQMYDVRQRMKDPAHYDPKEKVLKLGLNSLYGKLAQQRGWKEGQPLPKYHQLFWAGWITAKCRSMIYEAMMQNPIAIIACETDGIISMEQLDLPLGSGLGEWDYTEYDWITYVQSGLYFAGKEGKEVKLRSRGINAKSVSRAMILKGWTKYQSNQRESTSFITTKTKRFHTLASCIATDNMENWRQWMEQKKKISLVPLPTSKRGHLPLLCQIEARGECIWGIGHHHRTLAKPMMNELSYPYQVIWDEESDQIEDMYLARELEKEESIINE